MKALSSMLFLGCMLVLAALFSDVRPALGQSEGGCPIPEGVTPSPAPSVTAKEVEADPNKLEEFALLVRDESNRVTQLVTNLSEASYAGCVLRQEGEPWHYGSTYIASVIPVLTTDADGNPTPGGRVFFHAKDMTFGGRRLKDSVFLDIATAAGLSPSPSPVFLEAGRRSVDGNPRLCRRIYFAKCRADYTACWPRSQRISLGSGNRRSRSPCHNRQRRGRPQNAEGLCP